MKAKPKAANFFLGCFGFSRKPSVSGKKSQKNYRKHWFSRSTFLLKQSGGSRTVPVDSNLSDDKLETKISFMFKRSKLKKINSNNISLERENPAAQDTIPTSAPIVSVEDTPKETCDKNIIHENGKRLDVVMESPKKFSLRRKIDTKRNGSSQPGSPEEKSKPNRSIPQSTSLQAATIQHKQPEKSRVIAKKDRRKNEMIGKGFDPVIGMSIVMVTLIIMLLWGRLCAILCTCAWLYFTRRLKTDMSPRQIEKIRGEPDFSSDEYKKRVVLEGFLERDHRPVF
ncbi:uncharacterized protein At5g23160 isoform X2 [Ricinus communis]|uniref:Transmembrane protein n=1 Tax=Ricinus communis TaxID=3988 RepID=B9SCQ1_RICCO|nr:uncharacterized protein At5g23160 isoform X2 [Ricinus communis]EEF38619.1 conserved hypothetical protein [Ricinus communis]|eukprot:XP_002523770.1 uncharacterized protein At5g23160 isoform X2 [Ricinus communis]